LTAVLRTHARELQTGLRSVDPRRDMRAIGQLIELAFQDRLDANGQRIVRWMRRLGGLGWFGWILSWYLLPPAARPLGFVWEIGGDLVGNASLLEVQGYPGRWVIANVAVHPHHRNKGIGRELVCASIELARRQSGSRLLLQVDHDNQDALKLYTSLGFTILTARASYTGKVNHARYRDLNLGEARRRKLEEWKEQWVLARRVHPEGIVWPYPPTASFFRAQRLIGALNFAGGMHWVWREDDRLIGSVTAHPNVERGGWRLFMITSEAGRDRIEGCLLACCLSQLPVNNANLVLEYLDGVADKQILELGFSPGRSLTWMALEL
jgi:ribosomal protein S18 acetylase RimI-like enzyme